MTDFALKTVAKPIRGGVLYTLWLKSMGLRAPADVTITTEHISDFDLISLGKECVVCEGAKLRGAVLEKNGLLTLSLINMGPGCLVGEQAVIMAGSRLEDNVMIGPASAVMASNGVLPSGSCWSGSPLVCEDTSVYNGQPPALRAQSFAGYPTRSCCVDILAVLVGGCLAVLASFPPACFVASIISNEPFTSLPPYNEVFPIWIYIAFFGVFRPIPTLPFFFASVPLLFSPGFIIGALTWWKALLILPLILGIWALSLMILTAVVAHIGFWPCRGESYGVYGPTALGKTFAEVVQRFTEERLCLPLLSGTEWLNMWLRFLGARVSIGARVSSGAIIKDHPYLRLHEDSLIGNHSYMGRRIDRSRLWNVGPIVIKSRGIASPLSFIGPGSTVGAGAIVAPLSMLQGPLKDGAVRISRFSAQLTAMGRGSSGDRPFLSVLLKGLVGLLAPLPLLYLYLFIVVAPLAGIIWSLANLLGDEVIFWVGPLLFAGFGLLLMILVAATTWPVIALSKLRPSTYTSTPALILRTLSHQGMDLAIQSFASILAGSEAYNGVLRFFGARVGQGVRILATDFDGAVSGLMVEDGCHIGKDVFITGFVTEGGGGLSVSRSSTNILRRAFVGDNSYLPGRLLIGSSAAVGPSTNVLRGMEVPEESLILGSLPRRYVGDAYENRVVTGMQESKLWGAPDLLPDCCLSAVFLENADSAIRMDEQLPEKPLVAFVTGGNGFLGTHLVHDLVANDKVSTVYCLVRAKNDQDAAEKLLEVMEANLLNFPPETTKLRVLAGQLTEMNFGLPEEDYEALALSVTVSLFWLFSSTSECYSIQTR